jgi:hypothetical protein
MMSPSSGYSSEDEEEGATPYANAAVLSAVQQEVARLQVSKAAAAGASPPGDQAAANGGDGSGQGAAAAAPAGLQAEGGQSGSESDAETSSSLGGDDSSSSSWDEGDLPTPGEVIAAVQRGLAAAAANGNGHASKLPPAMLGLPPPGSSSCSNGSSSSLAAARLQRLKQRQAGRAGGGGALGRKGSSQQHPVHKRVLQAAGDGAAGDPARATLQDMLLDNKYSFKVQSEDSFVAAGHQPGDAANSSQQHQQRHQQQQQHARSRMRQQQRQDPSQQQERVQQQQPQDELLQPPGPVRHVGFQLPAGQQRGTSSSAFRAAAAASAAAGSMRQLHAAELDAALDSTASYSVDEVTDATASVGGRTASRAGTLLSRADSEVSVQGPAAGAAAGEQQQQDEGEEVASPPAAAAAVAAAEDEVPPARPLCARQDTLYLDPQATFSELTPADIGDVAALAAASTTAAAGARALEQQDGAAARSRDSLLSSSLKAAEGQQQVEQSEQPEQQQEQQPARGAAGGDPAAAAVRPSPSPDATASPASSREMADATAILDDTPSVDWGTEPMLQSLDSEQQQQGGGGLPPPGRSSSPVPHASEQQRRQQAAGMPVPVPPPAAQEGGAAAAADGAPGASASEPLALLPHSSYAASPPPDAAGYLGDNEGGALLGTSYEGGATPRHAAAALAAADISGPGSGPWALGLAGFQLSLCGHLLRPGVAPGEAQQVFETQRLQPSVWAEQGAALMADPRLVVRVGGSLYSWQQAGPMVVGMLAFGGPWDTLVGLDPAGVFPIKVAEDHAVAAKKVCLCVGSGEEWGLGLKQGQQFPEHQHQAPNQILPLV